MALKGGYPHYMLKEIHEQQQTVAAEITGRDEALDDVRLPRNIDRIVVAACGTAWHAGLVGKVAIEEAARVPVEVVGARAFAQALTTRSLKETLASSSRWSCSRRSTAASMSISTVT